MIAGSRFGNYKDGFRFGRLGYELVEKRGLTRYQARIYMSFGNIVMPWVKHPNVERLFQGLYTTRPDPLGVGLSISRSIILSHGGRLWATPNASYGATFQFVVPAWRGQRP